MSILIDKIRVRNFRALKDIEINLRRTTILVGANNAGKTTLLRALNSVLGITRNQINQDDLFVDKGSSQLSKEIIIDIRIVPTDEQGNWIDNFDAKWGPKLDTDIQFENNKEFLAVRTKYYFGIEDVPTISCFLLSSWQNETLDANEFKRFNQIRNNIKMYFIDAQRDILEDSKQRTSFFGKLVSQLDYGDDLEDLKKQISNLNKDAIEKAEVLKHLKKELKKLNQTTQTQGEGVSLNPFPKKISDLHKGMRVYFQDSKSDTFSMENHGMGTRSWASIITAGAFSSWQIKQAKTKIEKGEDTDLHFPIFALEEPEAHLHPNAQRTLYKQLKDFKGQKIVSTHSPYIAGQAALEELRHFFKDGDASMVSELLFDRYDREKIQELEQSIEAEGKTPEAYKKYNPEIIKLKGIANEKLTEDDRRSLKKEIFLNKGELLFARALLLFEGVTEEVALPNWYQYYFNRYPYEDGVTLVSVGGKDNYSPFLKFAKFFKIPVFILSDGDGTTESEVKKQVAKVCENLNSTPIFVLPENSDFEQFLVDSGYMEEIIQAIDTVKGETNFLASYINDLNGAKGKKGVIRDYNGEEGKLRALLDCMRENKTDFAEDITRTVVKSAKSLPTTLKDLFDKIAEQLNLKKPENA